MKSETTKRVEVEGVVITGVTGPGTIQQLATDLGINPQEVFVRVNFKVGDKEYTSSNKLRFFKESGYKRLLEAKKSGEPVNITVTANEKGTLMYLNGDSNVEVSDLFSTPVAKEDNRSDIADLF